MPVAKDFRDALAEMPGFRPRWPWLTGDLQTVRNSLLDRLGRPFSGEVSGGDRVCVPLGDGDTIVLRRNIPEEKDAAAPLVVLIHGLTGDEAASYMQVMTAAALTSGASVIRVNLRGAGPSRPLCSRQYHAGRTEDLRTVLGALEKDAPEAGILLVGVSLGGNMVLKLMGEDQGAIARVSAALSVSAPVKLASASLELRRPRNRIYHHVMIDRMREEARAAPGVTSERRAVIDGVRTVYDFDDRIVAPDNGFGSADRYYEINSSEGFLDGIRVPTVVLHGLDDPWIPRVELESHPWHRNGQLIPMLTARGGHVGFHSRDGEGSHDFLGRVLKTMIGTYSGQAQPDAPSKASATFRAP